MSPNVYNPKVHNKKLLTILVLGAIIIMFLVRGILYQNGTIEDMQTLEPEKIQERAAGYEVQIAAGAADGQNGTGAAQQDSGDSQRSSADHVSFGGTILDGRKQSTKEDNFTLTIVTSSEAAVPEAGRSYGTKNSGTGGSSDSSADKDDGTESSAYEAVAVTLPDGSQADGSVLYVDPDEGFAFVQCEYPTEVDAYYSRDILERLAADDPVYVLEDGTLRTGKAVSTKQAISGIGSDLTVTAFDTSGSGLKAGTGLYGTGGNYLGMFLRQSEDGNYVFASAVDIMKLLKQEL